MTYRGRVKNGTVVLDEPAVLPEGVQVTVSLLTPIKTATEDDSVPSLYEQLEPVIGMAKGLPPDLARSHDHYLHGHPKT